MIITANTYKTRTRTLDKAKAKLLIAEFSNQLKGWWDCHFTETQ